MTRHYLFTALRPGGFMNWPGQEITSDHRIRAVVLTVFRKWFGHPPTTYWGKEGWMAQAFDQHGNDITIEQINFNDPRWQPGQGT